MTKRILVSVAALCLALGACGSDPDDDSKPDACRTAEDCPEGQVCGEDGACKDEELPPACDPACSGETPICDEATGICKSCMADADCSGGTPICDTAANAGKGQCVGCIDTGDCTAPSVCDTSSRTCVGCTETEGCSGETPICDGGTCVACTAASGCEAGELCDTSVAGGRCVTCTVTAGCDSPQFCDTSVDGGVCVTCLADGTGCEAPTAVCDTAVPGGVCVGCVEDDHCVGKEICDDATKSCLTCRVTEGTEPDEGCTGGWPHCDPAANSGKGECYGCLADEHCTDPAWPVCDPVRKSCGVCVDDLQCVGTGDGTTPFCKGPFPGKCVTCLEDNSGCGGDTPACNPNANGGIAECWSCYGMVGCEGREFCDSSYDGGVCSICNETWNRCPQENPDAPFCDLSIPGGNCVECLESDHCVVGEVCEDMVCVAEAAAKSAALECR